MNPPERWRFHWRVHGRHLLELLALTGFVVAQPVFAVLSGATDYLMFRQVEGSELVALVLVVVVVPPVALWVVELLGVALFPGVGASLHRSLVGALLIALVFQVMGSVASAGALASIVGAVTAGAVLTVFYVKWRPLQLWMRMASPAPVVFAALFLFTTPVAGLLRTGSAPLAKTDTHDPSPVVLMVFDEFPLMTMLADDGHIDERLFPNFAGLGREATFFRNATSVAARTAHAVPSILTGRFPPNDVLPTTTNYPENLFTLLQSSHRVHAVESITALCPKTTCPRDDWPTMGQWDLLGDALRVWAHTVTPGAHGPEPLAAWFAEDTAESGPHPARFQKFLASIDGEGNPFHFLHLVLPHAPWRYLPDGRQYTPRDLGLVSYEERTDAGWPATVDHRRHILQAMYVDKLLGDAVERLKSVGLYQRSTLVVTADHGISFQPGIADGTRNLRPGNEHEIAWVPFLLKTPNQTTGAVRDDNVMSVDIAPTIADLAGVHTSWEVDGLSLVTDPPRDTAKVWFNEPGVRIALEGESAHRKVLTGAVDGRALAEDGVDGIFNVGPFRDIIGTQPSALPTVEIPTAAGKIDELSSYHAVDLAGPLPSLVSGYLDVPPDTSPARSIAIALNGTIAAVSDLYEEGTRAHRFAAMVSPRWMRSGTNTLELFLVVEGSSGPILGEVDVAAA